MEKSFYASRRSMQIYISAPERSLSTLQVGNSYYRTSYCARPPGDRASQQAGSAVANHFGR